MFGSNPSKTPFGSGFSSTTSAFGSQTPFGQSTQNTLFGNKTQVNTFGTPSFGTQTSGFGAGTSSSGSLFGTTTSTGGLFGQQQQAPGFSFGQTTGTGGIFGAASQTPGTGLFQTPQQSTSLFAAQKPGFGGFVTSSGTGGLFGSTTTNTPFGQTTATSGLFGGIGFGAGVTGTTVKFNPVQSTEHMQKNGTTIQVQTKHQCITVMKEYEQKSIEELRLEDYAANRKSGSAGLTTAAAGSTGLFGATTTTGSLFGSSGSTLGQSATSGFKAPFGQSTGGLFGQQQQQQPAGGLFGSKPVGTGSIFGTPSTSSTGFGTGGTLFGQSGTTGTGGLFGTQNTAASGGLFGGASSFGQTQTTSSGGLFGSTFGQPAQQTGGLFGAKPFGVSQPSTTTGTFGTSTFQFGGTSGTSTGLFGNPTTTKSLFSFSSGNQPNFGGTSTLGTSGGLFGQSSAGTTGGLFGAQKPSFGSTGTAFGNSFGTSSFGTAQGPTTGFGASTGLGGGLGGLGTQSTGLGLGTSTLAGVTQNTLALLQHQQTQQRLKALANSPFGDNPLFRNLPGSKSDKSTIISSSLPNRSPSTVSHYKVFSKPTLRVKPKPISSPSLGKAKLFEGLDEEDEPSPSTLVPRKNIKKLVIRNKSDKEASVDEPESLQLQLRSLIEEEGDDLILPTPDGAIPPTKGGSESSPGKVLNGPTQQGTEEDNLNSTVELFNAARKKEGSHDNDNGTLDGDENIVRITLTRSEYYTQPSIAELNQLCQDGHCIVKDFVVGREGYGEVEFPGETDVYGLNLDEIVFVRRREVELYPDGYPKPPVGQELNKEARITLHKLWPNDKTTHTPIKSPQRLAKSGFLEQLEEKTTEMGAVFIDYRPETGSWVFMVEHFTRYGLNEQLFAEDDAEAKKYLQKAAEDSALLAKQAEKKAAQLRVLGKEDIIVHREATEETSRSDSRGDQSLDEQEATDMSSQMDEDEDSDLSGEMEPIESAGFTPFSFKQAHALGVSSRRVQGMKAHLFDQSDDSHTFYMSPKEKKLLSASLVLNEKEREKTLLDRFDAPDILKEATPTKKWAMSPLVEPEMTPRSPQMLPKLSHLLKAPLMTQVHDEKDLATMQSFTPVVPMREERAKIVSAIRRPELCPVEKSLACGKHGLLADMGAGKSRSTRMGWMQSNKVIHAGEAISNMESAQALEDVDMGSHPSIFGSKQSDVTANLSSDFSLRVEKIEAKRDIQGGSHLTKEYLQNALKYSDVVAKGDSLPFIRTAPGNEALSSYHEIVESYRNTVVTGPDVDSLKNEGDIWSLANALWGNLETNVVGPDSRLKHTIAYEERVQRREAISKWLSSVLEDEISREVENSKFKDNGHLDAIFSLLTGRRIGAACQTALRNRDHRLALLLSQAAGDDAVRTLLRKQLTEWAELKADKFFDSRRLRIYLLLSGMMVVRSAHGVLNLCDELDWKRAFALHLWYYCSANSSVSDAMKEFSRAFKGTDTFDSYAAFPTPPYFQGRSDKNSAKDLSYHLLKLYCKRSHRLETILATDTHTEEAIDQQLSWHLHQCLSALGYTHLPGVSHDYLQASYAAQLERQGLWEWAVFVLLHIEDNIRREVAVTDVITRHCRVETGENETGLNAAEEFLVNSLEVPCRIIHSAKALSAKSQRLHHEEAIHLLKAERWNEAHRVVIDELSASAVIDAEYSYLRELLMHMTYPERCCTIKNWATGGQVFLDYCILREKLDALKKGEVNVTSYMLEDLEADTASLITRIGNMKCQSPKERLCQSEMAKTCSNLMKIVLAEMNSSDDVMDDDVCMWPTSKVAIQVTKLPFTPDCNLKELRELISHFTVDLEA